MMKKFFIIRWFMCMFIFVLNFLILSSTSFLFLWFCLEIQLFILILLLKNKSLIWFHQQWKYQKIMVLLWFFMIQVISSIILFWGFLINKSFFMCLSLSIKLGFFPVFLWMPYVYSKIPWEDIFILGFWSKMSMFLFLSIIMKNMYQSSWLMIFFLSSYMFSVLGIFNNLNNFKILMGWSSVSNLSLMLLISFFNNSIIWVYMFVYGGLFFFICYFFSYYSSFFLTSMILKFKSFLFMNIILIFFGFVLSGVPPFLIFWIKVFIFNLFLQKTKIFFCFLFGFFIFFQIIVYMKILTFLNLGNFISFKQKFFFMKKIFIFIILGICFI